MTNKYKRVASAASAAALALSGVMVPTNVFADDGAVADGMGAIGPCIAAGETVPADFQKLLSLDNGAYYCNSIDGALAYTDSSAHSIVLLDNILSQDGVAIRKDSPKNVTIDLNGKIVMMKSGSLVGSTNYENQNWHIEQGSNVTIKNGTIMASSDSNMLIQNYANLTLENVQLNGSNIAGNYVVSNNNGKVNVTGNTSIKAPAGKYALDAYWWPTQGYTGGTQVTIDTTGTIDGKVQLSSDGSANSKTTLTIKNGVFTGDLDIKDDMLNQVNIEGGTFTDTDVSDYVSDGYVAYTVKDSANKKVVAANSFQAKTVAPVEIVAGGNYDLSEDIEMITPVDYAGGWTYEVTENEDDVINNVDTDGVITANAGKGGAATVTVTAKENAAYSFDLEVNVVFGLKESEDTDDDVKVEFDKVVANGKRIEVEKNADIKNDESLATALATESSLRFVYDITVIDNNNAKIEIDGNNKATVTIKLNKTEDKLEDGENQFQIVYINEEGKIVEWYDPIRTELDGTYTLIFEVSHFSRYGVLVSKTPFVSAAVKQAAYDAANTPNDGDQDGDGEGNQDQGGNTQAPGTQTPDQGGIGGSLGNTGSVKTPDTGSILKNAAATPAVINTTANAVTASIAAVTATIVALGAVVAAKMAKIAKRK